MVQATFKFINVMAMMCSKRKVMTSHDLVINLFDLVVEILAQAENEDVA
jgi:hypothetical protein